MYYVSQCIMYLNVSQNVIYSQLIGIFILIAKSLQVPVRAGTCNEIKCVVLGICNTNFICSCFSL